MPLGFWDSEKAAGGKPAYLFSARMRLELIVHANATGMIVISGCIADRESARRCDKQLCHIDSPTAQIYVLILALHCPVWRQCILGATTDGVAVAGCPNCRRCDKVECICHI